MTDTTLQDLLKDAALTDGVLDAFLVSINESLQSEFSSGRITGPEYATVYLGSIQSAMAQAVSFALGLRTANAAANLSEIQAITEASQDLLLVAQELNVDADTALITQKTLTEVETTQKETASTGQITADTSRITSQKALIDNQTLTEISEKLNVEASTGLTGAKTTTEGSQNLLLVAQELNVDSDTALLDARTLTEFEVASKEAATTTRIFSENTLIQSQNLTEITKELKLDSEIALLDQKTLTEEAQIRDTVDTVAVTGLVGKQKELYAAQTDGFARDAEQKIMKIMFDAWSVARSTDTAGAIGLPNECEEVPINSTLGSVLANHGI